MAVFHSKLADYLLRSDAPRRPLDWRFQRAIELSRYAPRKRYKRAGDDELVVRYADLLHRLDHHSTYRDFERIRRRHPNLTEVHLAYATLNMSELAILDATLLCHAMDPDQIAAQTGLPREQQKIYRRMFLDIEGRRHMSTFIAMQLMEPTRLRGTASEYRDGGNMESVDRPIQAPQQGTLTLGEQCALRVLGFYSSPVLLELVYTGFLGGTVPAGRDSAMRFMGQATLSNIRRSGLLATANIKDIRDGTTTAMKLAVDLAVEEKEDGQFDIIQNIETTVKQFQPRIGHAGTILADEKLPDEVFDGNYELTEEEMVYASETGTMPGSVAAMKNAERKLQ